MSRRVVITGLGARTSIGSTVGEFWQACLAGRSTVAPIPAKWRDFYRCNSPVWAPLPPDTDDDGIVNDIERSKLDRVAVLAMRPTRACPSSGSTRSTTASRSPAWSRSGSASASAPAWGA